MGGKGEGRQGVMVATTTTSRAKKLVKQGLNERNGMIAFGSVRERFWQNFRCGEAH